MAEYSLDIQGLGHFGTCSYETDAQQWSFLKSEQPNVKIQVLKQPSLISGTQVLQAEHQRSRLTRGDGQFGIVQKDRPECYGLHGQVQVDLIASSVLAKARDEYDCAQGSSIALSDTTITIEDEAYVLCLTASGPNGSRLQILLLRLGTADDQGEYSLLKADASKPILLLEEDHQVPILQLCLAPASAQQGTKTSHLLALRMYSCIIVASLGINTDRVCKPTDAAGSVSYEKILHIPLKGKEDNQHVDVRFNPWCRQEIAVINKLGRWSFYHFREISATQPFVRFDPQPLLQGTIDIGSIGAIGSQDDAANASTHTDGWATVKWVANPAAIAICSRTSLQFLNLRTRSTVVLDTRVVDEVVWHLDMKVAGHAQDDLFLLTTSRLIWIRVSMQSRDKNKSSSSVQPEIVQSVRHSHDPTDLTLKIDIISVENAYHITLSSRRSLHVTYVSCAGGQMNHDWHSLSLAWAPKSLSNSSEGDISTRGLLDMNTHVYLQGGDQHKRIISVMSLSDHSLWTSNLDLTITTNATRSKESAINARSSDARDDRNTRYSDSFIVANGHAKPEHLAIDTDAFVSDKMRRNEKTPLLPARNMYRVYARISGLSMSPSTSHKYVLGDDSNEDLGLGVINRGMTTSDEQPTNNAEIIRTTSMLRNLCYGLSFVKVPETALQIRSAWVDHLPTTIREVQNDRIAALVEDMALELHLGLTDILDTDIVDESSSRERFELPILNSWPDRSRTAPARAPLAAAKLLSSQSLILTDARPAIQNAPSDADDDDQDDSIIGKYVRLGQPLPAQMTSTIRNLQHWQTGQDPSTYDFLGRWSADDQFIELTQLTEDERKRAEQRERARKKRQLKESQKFLASQQSQNMPSSMPWDPSFSSQVRDEEFTMPVASSQGLLKQALASQRERNTQSQVPLNTQDSQAMLGASSQASLSGSQMSSKKKKRKLGF